MKYENLFESSKVAYIALNVKNVCQKKQQLRSYAFRHKLNYKVEEGVFFKTGSVNGENVLRIEKIEKETKMDKLSRDIKNNESRDDEIVRLHNEGLTYKQIGERFGVTKGRIGQIITEQKNKKVRLSKSAKSTTPKVKFTPVAKETKRKKLTLWGFKK